jgi:hypothetical protein
MKVKELIEKLSGLDPEARLVVISEVKFGSPVRHPFMDIEVNGIQALAHVHVLMNPRSGEPTLLVTGEADDQARKSSF